MNQKSGSQRLARLLKLIPFLQKNSGISLEQTAILFGISEKQLISDLNLIWLCGLPGYSHLELIDVSYDSGFITISNAETLNRPMRITFEEGAALLLAIVQLIEIAPPADSQTLRSLQEKISKIISLDFNSESTKEVETNSPLVLPEIQSAMAQRDKKVALNIDYYSATLDEHLQSQIYPLELSSERGFTYLFAYSVTEHRYRYFRLDRISGAHVISNPESVKALPSETVHVEPNTTESGKPIEVSIEITQGGSWIVQKWGITSLLFDGERQCFTGQIAVHNPIWLERATLSAGGALSVVAPERLRAQMVEAAHRALEKYGDPLK